MATNRNLPDLSHHSWSIYEERFKEDFATQLEEKFKIPKQFGLLCRLNNDANFWYRDALIVRPPKLSDQKKVLEAVHKLATDLDEALTKLGGREYALISKATPDIIDFHLDKTIYAIVHLKNISRLALDSLPVRRGARRKDAIRTLVTELYAIYGEATNDKRRITYNSAAKIYTGRGYEFIEDCLLALNIHKSNSAIGGYMREAAKFLESD